MASIIQKSNLALYCQEKQVVEAQLAKALYDKFNQGEALKKLQVLALRCIKEMVEGPSNACKAACDIEGSLSVWGKIGPKTPQGLKEFYEKPGALSVGTFNASDVSDIIRLFGQWVEGNTNAGKSVVTDGGNAREGLVGAKQADSWGQSLTPSFAVKDAYRPGVTGAQQGGDFWKKQVEDVWGDNAGRFQGMQGLKRRDRANVQGAVPGHVDLRDDKSAFAGMQGKRAQQDSNILKIDRMFGLLVACDISGTTADTVFALEMLGADFLSAAYYMLPLATIVHNHHHSLIEVATALTLNGVIDYEIGIYTSLMPDSVKTEPGELAGTKEILRQYEYDPRNRHFVTFYSVSNNELAGGYLFDRTEAYTISAMAAGSYKKSPLSASHLLSLAPNLPNYPTVKSLGQVFGDSLKITSI